MARQHRPLRMKRRFRCMRIPGKEQTRNSASYSTRTLHHSVANKHHGRITHLFEGLEDLLGIVHLVESLDCGQGLPSVPLLDTWKS